ncbi:hypothetical protein B6U98_04615 [Thermoplasmatales archaeon ex4572_165]|nr:MAG: hypothetical protein B6U98_04615 [Thermoplasmatales archaeon ex4572_165]
MEIQLPILLMISGTLYYLFFIIYSLKKMKNEMNDFSWKSYCKNCGIYHQQSHWTDIIKAIRKIKKQINI